MKTVFLICCFMAVVATFPCFAQAAGGSTYVLEPGTRWEYARMIGLESIVAGGAGRSRLYVNTPDGKLLEEELSNYYSLVGINFKNVINNEVKKTKMLNQMAEEGWEVYWVETGAQEGIYVTKYLMRRIKQ